MKPSAVINLKKSESCKRSTFYSFSQQRWQQALPLQRILAKRLKPIAPVTRALRAGLAAYQSALSSQPNLALALWLLAVVAPLSSVAYQFFNAGSHVPGWYYVNTYYFLFILGPHLYMIFTLLGLFFLFPRHSKRAFFLVMPLGITLAKAIWLATAQSNDQFHHILPAWFALVGILVAGMVLLTIGWLTHTAYHRWDALLGRMEGIINVPGVTGEAKVDMMRPTVDELKKYHTQF